MLNRCREIVLTGLLLAWLAGCGGNRVDFGEEPAAAAAARDAAPLDEISAFLSRAGPGASAVLSDATAGAPRTIVIKREYQAASGRLCRRIDLIPPSGRAEDRVACRDAFGVWRLLPPLINRALPALAVPTGAEAGRTSGQSEPGRWGAP